MRIEFVPGLGILIGVNFFPVSPVVLHTSGDLTTWLMGVTFRLVFHTSPCKNGFQFFPDDIRVSRFDDKI
jgi:hypothetical protein